MKITYEIDQCAVLVYVLDENEKFIVRICLQRSEDQDDSICWYREMADETCYEYMSLPLAEEILNHEGNYLSPEILDKIAIDRKLNQNRINK